MIQIELPIAVVSFQSDYYFGDHLRWNLGFPTPNYAGAFIASAFPFLWGVASYLKLRPWAGKSVTSYWGLIWFFGAEGALTYTLWNTYSRGGLLGVFAALLYFTTCQYVSTSTADSVNRRSVLTIFSTRIFVWGLLLWGTGFFKRAESSFAGTDASVLNRWELWKNCAEMIYASPLSGWGAGESGRAYMNWFQDAFRSEGFLTPVNSYLHIAVEYGLPIMGLGLVILLTILIAGIDQTASRRGTLAGSVLLPAAGASIAAWLVCNVFTTLWMDYRLAILPLLGCAYLVGCCIESKKWRAVLLPLAASFLVTMLLSAAIYFYGSQRTSFRSLTVLPAPGGVLLTKNDPPEDSATKVICVLDEEVLGPFPGKEIRMWMLNTSDHRKVLALTQGKLNERYFREPKCEEAFLFGRRVQAVAMLPSMKRVWFIHPQGPVPSAPIGSEAIVVLPEIDQTGDAEIWRRWAFEHGKAAISSKGVGFDIRPIWPQVMLNDR